MSVTSGGVTQTDPGAVATATVSVARKNMQRRQRKLSAGPFRNIFVNSGSYG